MLFNKILYISLQIAVLVAVSHAVCNTSSGCKSGVKLGEIYEENCMTCKCGGAIYQGPTRLCYLPFSDKVSPIPLYQLRYDGDDHEKICPPGYTEVAGEDIGNIKAKMILAYTPNPVGGETQCCDENMKPVRFDPICKRIRVGCEWKLVLKADETIKCPVEPYEVVVGNMDGF